MTNAMPQYNPFPITEDEADQLSKMGWNSGHGWRDEWDWWKSKNTLGIEMESRDLLSTKYELTRDVQRIRGAEQVTMTRADYDAMFKKSELFDWLCDHAEGLQIWPPNTGFLDWDDDRDEALADWLQGVKESSDEGPEPDMMGPGSAEREAMGVKPR